MNPIRPWCPNVGLRTHVSDLLMIFWTLPVNLGTRKRYTRFTTRHFSLHVDEYLGSMVYLGTLLYLGIRGGTWASAVDTWVFTLASKYDKEARTRLLTSDI